MFEFAKENADDLLEAQTDRPAPVSYHSSHMGRSGMASGPQSLYLEETSRNIGRKLLKKNPEMGPVKLSVTPSTQAL